VDLFRPCAKVTDEERRILRLTGSTKLRDRVRARVAANRQSINSFLLDLIEREMQLPSLDDWLDGLDGLPKLPDVTTDENGGIREIRESS